MLYLEGVYVTDEDIRGCRMKVPFTSCAILCCLVSCLASARGGEADARLARARIARLDKIRDDGTAKKNWREIVGYLRTGPTTPVRRRCGLLLAKVRTAEVRRALLAIAPNKAEDRRARQCAVTGLVGHARSLKDEDIEKMLKSDEKMNSVLIGVMVDVAPKCDLSLAQVNRILARYKKSKNWNIDVGVVLFAGRYLKNHEDEKSKRETRPVLVRFLYMCARRKEIAPANLRPNVARGLMDSKLPGAVEVFIQCLRDDLKRQAKGGMKCRPTYTMATLRKLTGQSLGYDGKTMKAGSTASIAASRKWIAWWEKNKENPKYKLPDKTAAKKPK